MKQRLSEYESNISAAPLADKNPLFSIIIPTRNRPHLLLRSCKSALAAAKHCGEVIVVDDGSSEPAIEVLKGTPDPRLFIISLKKSGGVGAARNAGVATSRGRVIFFLDDDDEIDQDYCSKILAGPCRLADFGFSNFSLISKDGHEGAPRPRFKTGVIRSGHSLRRRICGMGMGFWINREAVVKAGYISEDLPLWEDAEYTLRLISFGATQWYNSEPSLKIYSHADSASGVGNVTSNTKLAKWEFVIRKTLGRHPYARRDLSLYYVKACSKAHLYNRGFHFVTVNSKQIGYVRSNFLIIHLVIARWISKYKLALET